MIKDSSSRYNNARRDLWEAADGGYQHGRYFLDKLEHTPDGDDGSFHIVWLHHVDDLKQFRSVNRSWVMKHALEEGSKRIVLDGE